MKVQNIGQYPQYKNQNYIKEKTKQVNSNFKNFDGNFPSTKQFLSFRGGYSLNLQDTYINLKDEDCPPDIKKLIEDELEVGNYLNKTLCDIHFAKYRDILKCSTLEELKCKYPEFKDVVSAWDVETGKNSFIQKYKNGNISLFPPNEDLTLQLIKLYWGQGLSLNSLSKYIEDNSGDTSVQQLYYTMTKKLNIPMMSINYAQVFKLSDKNYNERHSKILSEKLKAAAELKVVKRLKESFGIEEREIHEHTENNNNQISEKETLLNPEYQELKAKIAYYAWNEDKDGKEVKKVFLKQASKASIDINDDFFKGKINKNQEKFLETFWLRFPWAKEKLSNALSRSREHFTKLEIQEIIANYFDVEVQVKGRIKARVIPSKIQDDISKWMQTNNFKIQKSSIGTVVVSKVLSPKEEKYYKEISKSTKSINEMCLKYELAHPNVADIIATTLQYSLLKFKKDLEINGKDLPSSLRNNRENRLIFKSLVDKIYKEKCICKEDNGKIVPLESTSEELTKVLGDIFNIALNLDCDELGAYFTKNADIDLITLSESINKF